jgi:DNA-binding CsgD family transcriptional regulator
MGEAAVAAPPARGALPGVSNAPMALLALDGDGRVREASPAACGLLGLDREEILGHELSELLTPRRNVVALSARAVDAPTTDAHGDVPGRRPTARESQILAMLAAGDTDADIAERLELSPATVQTHVRNAKQKLGAKTRAQAVAIALRGGLVPVG